MGDKADILGVRLARDRFEQTRIAIDELNEINLLIMYDGEDWKPDGVRVPGVSDPTAAHAIRNVDEWGEKLAGLRKRQAELMNFIGITLVLIRRVRDGLGDKYADVLEQRYIDCQKWKHITDSDGNSVDISKARRMVNVACDWVDSVGVSRLMRGDIEV